MTSAAQLAAFGAVALIVLVVGICIILRALRGNPEKRERRRRLEVNRAGRLGDAFITDANGALIYYEYSVHGVQYMASQDVTLLRELLPAEPERLIGVANLKYAPNNPANSILVCEEWSGLRAPPAHLAAG
jgi:hypothetical protein